MALAPAAPPPPRRSIRSLRWLASLGLPGIFAYSIIDSSPLPLLGGSADLLTMFLGAAHHLWWGWYGLAGGLGSVIGGWISYELAVRTEHHRLRDFRVAKYGDVLRRHGGLAVLVSCFLPPPFPLSLFMMTAGVARVPRTRVLTAFGVGRLIRFELDAWLGYRFGRELIRVLRPFLHVTPVHIAIFLGLVAICVLVAAWRLHRLAGQGSHTAG